jgi:ParB family chromosome partitioning protein
MVAHVICGSPLWAVKVQEQRTRGKAITESIETSVAEARFDERRRAVLEVLGFDADEPTVTQGREPVSGITGLLLRLLDLPDPVVMDVLALVMAETLASGSTLIETVGVQLGTNMTDYWTADEAFYSLIRDREVLAAILSEVGGAAVAQAHVAEKGKTIKSVINDYLTGDNGRTKIAAWVPRWMAFPPSAYTQRGGVSTVGAAERGQWQAEVETQPEPKQYGERHGPVAVVALPAPEGGTVADAAEALDDAELERLAA